MHKLEHGGTVASHLWTVFNISLQANLITEQFKIYSVTVNAKHEPVRLSNAAIIAANKQLAKSKKKKIHRTKSTGSQQQASSEYTAPISFSVSHCGSMSLNHRRVDAELIDTVVSCLSLSQREGEGTPVERRARWKTTKKSRSGKTNTMFRHDSNEKDVNGVESLEDTESSVSPAILNLPTDSVPDVIIDEEKVMPSVGKQRNRSPLVPRCASLDLPKRKRVWRSGDSESSGSDSPAGQCCCHDC